MHVPSYVEVMQEAFGALVDVYAAGLRGDPRDGFEAVYRLLESRTSGNPDDLFAAVRVAIRLARERHPEAANDLARLSLAPPVQAFLHYMSSQGWPKADQANVYVTSWLIERMREAGSKHYAVAPNLAERLLATEVRGVPARMLRLPYEALTFVVPPDVGGTALAGITVAEEVHEGTRAWQVNVESAPDPVEAVPKLLKKAGLVRRRRTPDYLLANVRVSFPDEEADVSEVFAQVEGAVKRLAAQPSLSNLTVPDETQRPEAQLIRAFRLLLNSLLYIGWPGADVRERNDPAYDALVSRRDKTNPRSPKRDELNARIRVTPARSRVVLGLSARPIDGVEANRMLQRILVAGHWKMQPHGEGQKLRKLIHIEPYWRGPLNGETTNKPHLLE